MICTKFKLPKKLKKTNIYEVEFSQNNNNGGRFVSSCNKVEYVLKFKMADRYYNTVHEDMERT